MARKVAPIGLAVYAPGRTGKRQRYGLQDLHTQLCARGMNQRENPDWPGDWQKNRAGKENL